MTHLRSSRAFRRRLTALGASFTVLAASLLSLSPVAASDGEGAALTVSPAVARSAMTCSGTLADSPVAPVLFLHGTTSSSAADWSWNWNRAFQQLGWAYCDLDLPQSGNGDIAVAAQYVVQAIRSMSSTGHRKVSLVGHSQGGMIGRWALKYWPDTRSKVDDYVALVPSNHGTDIFNLQCANPLFGCPAANWQQSAGSHFMAALNDGPQTWPGISYTNVSTILDEVVVPYTSAFLPAAPNVTNTTVQQLCPLDVVEHFGMSYDNAAWLIGVDALTHVGAASMPRVRSTAACGNPLMPGVDPAAFPLNAAKAVLQTGTAILGGPNAQEEPPLPPYAQ